ncbi:hypothetical protein PFISCL1PPCAC_11735, partial [Pristionchus fissidentatus]
ESSLLEEIDDKSWHVKPTIPTIASANRLVCPNTCAVCGDKAAGYHYDVGSCSGCKTFFRRTIQAERKFYCRFNGLCKQSMQKDDRIRCRACRFDRCVDAGMNPLAITSIADPESNPIICDILRKRGEQFPIKEETDLPKAVKVFIPCPAPQSIEALIDRAIEELLFLEVAHQRLRRSKLNPNPHDPYLNLDWCITGPSRMGVDYGEVPQQEVHPLLPAKHIPIEIRIRDRIPYPSWARRVDAPEYLKPWLTIDLIYTIEWLKTFSFFSQLDRQDKRILIRFVTRKITLLTAAFFSYDTRHSDVSVMPDGVILITADLPREALQDRDFNFGIIARMKNVGMDKMEYVLIKAIVACDPTHEDLSKASRIILQEQRERFTKSLMSYVLAKRGTVKGPSAYVDMMSLIAWLAKVIKRGKENCLLLSALGLKGPDIPVVLEEILNP